MRILVVDDEPDVRELLVDMLEEDGHTVRSAAGGSAALALLAGSEGVDLVLTDLGMPGMSGWELASQVKAGWPRAMVGVITGWGDDPEDPRAETRAATFVLAKPFTIQKLREALARLDHP